MMLCDHEFYSTNYLLAPEYHPEKVRPHLKVEFCSQCGILRVGHPEKEILYDDWKASI